MLKKTKNERCEAYNFLIIINAHLNPENNFSNNGNYKSTKIKSIFTIA